MDNCSVFFPTKRSICLARKIFVFYSFGENFAQFRENLLSFVKNMLSFPINLLSFAKIYAQCTKNGQKVRFFLGFGQLFHSKFFRIFEFMKIFLSFGKICSVSAKCCSQFRKIALSFAKIFGKKKHC